MLFAVKPIHGESAIMSFNRRSTPTSWYYVEYTGCPLPSDAVARPTGQRAVIRVDAGGVVQHAHEPLIVGPRVRHRQNVAAGAVVCPRELHVVVRHRFHFAPQRHRLVASRGDLQPLTASSASRRVCSFRVKRNILARSIRTERKRPRQRVSFDRYSL